MTLNDNQIKSLITREINQLEGTNLLKITDILEILLPFQEKYFCCCLISLLLGKKEHLIDKNYFLKMFNEIINAKYPVRFLDSYNQAIGSTLYHKSTNIFKISKNQLNE